MGLVNNIETDRDRNLAKDQIISREIMRMMEAVQSGLRDAELLTELLSGAPRDVEHVQKIFKFAKKYFSSDRHFDRNKLQLRLCGACVDFLEKHMDFDEFEAFKSSFDSPGNILDELAYQETKS